MKTGQCFWRFKGDKAYRYGYATHVRGVIWRMGLWNGDDAHGPYVDEADVEVNYE